MKKVRVTFLFTILSILAFTPGNFAKEIEVEIQQDNFSLREKINAKVKGYPKDTFYLKLVEKLPKGTVLTYNSEKSVSKVLYNNDDDKIKRSRGDFFRVKIVSIPNRDRSLKLFLKTLYVSETAITYTGNSFSNHVKSITLKQVDARERVYDKKQLPSSSRYDFYLKKKVNIPKGSIISFNPRTILELPYYKSSDGKIKKSSGRYIGPLRFEKVPGMSASKIDQLNDQKLFTFEKGISLSEMNQKLYSIPNNFDGVSLRGKVLWDGLSFTKNWSKMAKNLVLANAKRLIEDPPSDIKDFCPKYEEKSDGDRAEFWVHLMATIAKFESDFQPGRINDESAFGNGQEVISRGLLQISHGSVQTPRIIENGCKTDNAQSLHHPKTNLVCGLALFKVLSSGNGKNCISCKYTSGNNKDKFAGIARYWSTLRPNYEVDCRICSSGKASIGKKAAITKMTKALSVCR